MGLTTRGYPYPEDAPTVPNDVPGDLLALAAAINADVGGLAASAQPRLVVASAVDDATYTSTSTAVVDLAGILSAPIVVGVTGMVLVLMSAQAFNSGAGQSSMFVVSNNGLIAAASRGFQVAGTDLVRATAHVLHFSTPGTTVTYTAKHQVTSGTGTWSRRRLELITF